jgi:protein SCO1/2
MNKAMKTTRAYILTTALALTVIVVAVVAILAASSALSSNAVPQHQSDEKEIQECTLLTQDSLPAHFPSGVLARKPALITVAGFIYTHCPGVCETITETMKRASYLLGSNNAHVQFLALTFDPERDTPSVLRDYGNLHNLADEMHSGRWLFLTGSGHTVDSLVQHYGIVTRRSYTTVSSTGERVYFIDHTDRITLLDERGVVLKEYEGSEVAPETLVAEIQRLSKKVARSHVQ